MTNPNELLTLARSLTGSASAFLDLTDASQLDLVTTVAPRSMEVEGEFNVRGGILTTVVARHKG